MKKLPQDSNLATLDPFLDEEENTLVKGQVDKAVDLSYSQKHPLILPPRIHGREG